MALRTFHAATLPEAMARVRAELGPSAVVVSWRPARGGIELTATGREEPAASPQAPTSTRADTSADTAEFQAWNDVLASRAERVERPRAPRHDVFAKTTVSPQAGPAVPRAEVAAEPARPAAVRPKAARPAPAPGPGSAAEPAPESRPAPRRAGLSPRQAELMALGLPAIALKSWQPLAAHADLHVALAAALADRILPLIIDPIPEGPLLVAGAPGSGKTATLAKLAARALRAGGRVCLITTDTERAGGTAQVSAFAERLGARLEIAGAVSLAARLTAQALDRGETVLIDTPAAHPLEPADVRLVARIAEDCGARALVCLPADGRADDLGDAATAWREAGAAGAVLTRLDLTRRGLGGIDALARAGLSLAFCGVSPFIAEGLMPPGPARLASFLTRDPTALDGLKRDAA